MTRIDDMSMAMKAIVDAGVLAGLSALIWRGGEVIWAGAFGARDRDAGLPVERDTLFRIASLSKPITTVAALMLYEEGRFALTDPISRFAPEFKAMRVLADISGPLDQTVAAEREVTFEDLLTHRSGITYGSFHQGPIATAYAQALGGDIDSFVAPDDWIRQLAALPLIDQPGAKFHYGHSTDLLGLLIARMENAPLGDVLERKIFSLLGMKDTFFVVPSEKMARCSQLSGFNDTGQLETRLTAPGGSTLMERPADMTFVSGGQGLWSTLDDFCTFAHIFVGSGQVSELQLLKPETVALMMSNQLTSAQRQTSELGGLPIFASGHGFGMGVAVVLEPESALPTICGGNVGSVGWPGAFGGWWQADPTDNSVMVFLTHNMLEPKQFETGIGLGVYGAIGQFQALASRLRANT